MKKCAVIMAGGKGERFWPHSRGAMPKQFLSFTPDGLTMIQLTVKRLLPIVAYEDMFIVTNRNYVDIVTQQLPDIPLENILAEPVARNTAPAIGLAAIAIARKYDDAVMMVLASDHLIKNQKIYLDTMLQAATIAKDDENLITIGITPTYAETGYGYINFGQEENGPIYPGVYPVKRFVEKPDVETAKEYLASGEYLWNSGMFVWKVSTILKKYKELLPAVYTGLLEIEKAMGTHIYESVLNTCFHGFKSESIDYGIMEHATKIYTIPGSFGWDDVGSWLSVGRINPTNESGNMVQGDVITINTRDSIIVGGKRLISVIGLEDLVVVDTDDALLICDKDHTQEIKKVVEHLKICNRNELL